MSSSDTAPRSPEPPADLDVVALEEVALQVALRCAALVVHDRPRGLGVAATKSSATDVVTAMDTASEQLARRLLAELRPEDGFFGEEGGSGASASGITWVVDPIDGTVNYLYEHPLYCVSVAAVVGDPTVPGAYRPVAAAVVAPVLREGYTAALGHGARLHEITASLDAAGPVRTLRPAPPTTLDQTLLGTGFAYQAPVRATQGALVRELLPLVRDIRRGGSAAIDLCWVALGRLDAYAEHGLNPWDLAGGWLVVTEAGGVVCDLDGADPSRSWTIAGGADAVPLLRAALEAAGGRTLVG